MPDIIHLNAAERTFALPVVVKHPKWARRVLFLLCRLRLRLKARSARYCSSGSTPMKGRLVVGITGRGVCITYRVLLDPRGVATRFAEKSDVGGFSDLVDLERCDLTEGFEVVRVKYGMYILVEGNSPNPRARRGVLGPSGLQLLLSMVDLPVKS